MGDSTSKRAGSYLSRKAALRLLPWAWPLYAGVGLYRAVEHELTQRDRAALRRIARSSLGIPPRLSSKERAELRRELAKLSPFSVAHFIAAEASSLPWAKAPASR
jgi:hypothetical protein